MGKFIIIKVNYLSGMVEQNQDENNNEAQAPVDADAPVAGESGGAGGSGADDQWVTSNTEPMDATEEANLAAFLQKVSVAC